MKRILWMLIILLAAISQPGRSMELPDPAAITADFILATKNDEAQERKGYILNNNYQYVDLRKDKADPKGVKIPQSAINYVFYVDADNSTYIEALRLYHAHKYAQAAEAFADAGQNLKNFKTKTHADEFVQYARFYGAMCHFRLGAYDKAIALFDLALQPRDAIFKFQGEYYLARSLEAQGKYADAQGKYSLLVNAVFPEYIAKAEWGQRWSYLCQLGAARAKVLDLTLKSGQAGGVETALKDFETLFESGGDKIDDEVRSDALMATTAALKYLAKDKPENFTKIISLLEKPLNAAIAVNDRGALGWMYLDVADSYWGLMEAPSESKKKKENAQNAFFEYLRLSMVYDLPPAQNCKVYYRLGKLFETLQGQDWKKRAQDYYKLASSAKFKDFQPYVFAQEALKKMKN